MRESTMKTTSTRRMAPGVRAVAGLAVLVAGLSGCASRTSASSTDANGAAAGSVATTTAPAPSDSASSSAGTAAQSTSPAGHTSSANPTGGPKTMPTVPANTSGTAKTFSPDGITVAKDGVTLSVPVEWGGCSDKPQIVVVSQDSSKILVEMKQTSHNGAGVMCPDHAHAGVATLKLSAPLGSRQLVDAVLNAPIAVH